jgi:glycosyltransferase involved in cell wall biosynthesis
MIFDVSAKIGGALEILNQYYYKAVKDTLNKWIFVISTPILAETRNIKVLNFNWIKKSWLHRLFFDYIIAPKLVRNNNPDEILSLQNILIPCVRTPQTLYLHQPLPFVEKRYTITENILFWTYQNLISRFIFSSLKKANKIIIQTHWMKEVCLKKGISESKIIVEPPVITYKITSLYNRNYLEPCLFIYPASALSYKNHDVIIKASVILKEKNIEDYKILFTLNGKENKLASKLYKTVKKNNLNINFIGNLSKEDLFSYYEKSVLLFPSYIETFGLPILEARIHQAPIIVSDCAFSHEILDSYDKVSFFKYDDEYSLYEFIKRYILKSPNAQCC